MSWVAVGIAAVGAGASIYSSNKASKAMGKASSNELALQQQMYDTQRQDSAPYREVGGSALNAYARAMGLPQSELNQNVRNAHGPIQASGRATSQSVNQVFMEVLGRAPTAHELKRYTRKKRDISLALSEIRSSVEYQTRLRDGSLPGRESGLTNPNVTSASSSGDDRYGGFESSPGYQFRLDEGARGLDRNMAARGLLNSGARGKAMTRYNQGAASDEFGNYMNRLAGAAGIGQTAVQQGNHAAQNYAQGGGNSMMNRGMARASGYLGAGNAISSGVNNVLGAMPYMNFGRGGGGGAQTGYAPVNVKDMMNQPYDFTYGDGRP